MDGQMIIMDLQTISLGTVTELRQFLTILCSAFVKKLKKSLAILKRDGHIEYP